MKSSKGHHNSRRNNILLKELENPLARKVKNRYKLLANCTKKLFPQTLEKVHTDKLADIIFDAISLDRKARKETENEEVEQKQILSEQWQLDNL